MKHSPLLNAFILATSTWLAASGTALASIPSFGQMPSAQPAPTIFKKRFAVCDQRAIKFGLLVIEKITPNVPDELRESLREIFRESATELFEYLIKITETPIGNKALKTAMLDKHKKLNIEHKDKLRVLLQALPEPGLFKPEDFGAVDLDLEIEVPPNICVAGP